MKDKLFGIIICLGVFLTSCSKSKTSNNSSDSASNDTLPSSKVMDSVLLSLNDRFILKTPVKELNANKINLEFYDLPAIHKLTKAEKQQYLGKFQNYFDEDDIFFYNLQSKTKSHCMLTYIEFLYQYSCCITAITYDSKFNPVDLLVVSIAHADAGSGCFANSVFSNDTTFTRYCLNFQFSDQFDSVTTDYTHSICENDSVVESYYINSIKGFVKFDSLEFHSVDTTHNQQ